MIETCLFSRLTEKTEKGGWVGFDGFRRRGTKGRACEDGIDEVAVSDWFPLGTHLHRRDGGSFPLFDVKLHAFSLDLPVVLALPLASFFRYH